VILFNARPFLQTRLLHAMVVLAMLYGLAGCKSGKQRPAATNVVQTPSAPARVVEPLTFVPPKSVRAASETLAVLRKQGENFKDYKLSPNSGQVKLQDVSLLVLNHMTVFSEPVTDSQPGYFGFGGKDRALKQDEQDEVTKTVKKAAFDYLNKRFRVVDGAQYEVVMILAGAQHPGEVRIIDGFNPYGIEAVRILFLDTQAKMVLWSVSLEGYGKTLGSATQVTADGLADQFDILFGTKRKTQ
jgi:hypothetical protein